MVAACVAVLTVGPAPVRARADQPVPAGSTGPVVVLGVPDLRWQDVTAASTPALWQLAARSSIGAMTDQSGEGDARRATGWLTLGTGSRAVTFVPPLALPDPADPVQLSRLRQLNRSAHYNSQVGALGDALHRAGRTVAVVDGPGAVLGGMNGAGTVNARVSSVTAALRGGADVVLVELPQVYDVERQDSGAVQAGLTAVDTAVAAVVRQLPGDATLLVVGVSDGVTGGAHLHVAMAHGPAFGAGRLTSASTGRDGVVQLIDVAPTVLGVLGLASPPALIGQGWERVSEARRPAAVEVADLVDLDGRSIAQVATQSPFFLGLVVVALLYVGWVLVAWFRRRTGPPLLVSACVAAVPVASWLLQLFPWWRIGAWSMAPVTAAFALVIGLAAALSPRPRSRGWRSPAIVGGVTAAVIAVDAATGSALSLDAPFGDNPIIAGRFHGIGNIAFALLGAGTLVLAAALVAGRRSPRGAAAVLVLGGAAVIVDGYPRLGDDLGGVLALLPAICVLALVVSGIRVSWRYLVGILVATLATVVAFAVVDYSRPASQRTHLGRFVQQLADGSAWPVIRRKLDSSLATFAGGWPRYLVLIWLVLVVIAVLLHRRGHLRIRDGVSEPTVGAVAAALAVLGILGAALNDSGLATTAFVLFVGAPLLSSLLEPDLGVTGPPTAPEHGPGENVPTG